MLVMEALRVYLFECAWASFQVVFGGFQSD